MNQDCFKPLKDFSLYEINAKGDVRKCTTKRRLTPQKTHSGDRFNLHDSGHIITISRNKLCYCYEWNVSPYELRGKVVSDGVLMTIAEHCSYLHITNIIRSANSKKDYEKEDLIHQYEYNINAMTLLLKLLKNELTEKEGIELRDIIESVIRKGVVRYYRNKKEYRKEEIQDLGRDIVYDTFLNHCPFNIDCYVYEIVKRKLGNKKNLI